MSTGTLAARRTLYTTTYPTRRACSNLARPGRRGEGDDRRRAWLARRGCQDRPEIARPQPPGGPEIAILSDKDGGYEWPLRPGLYDVLVRASGYEDVTWQVTVAPRTVATLDFTVRPAK